MIPDEQTAQLIEGSIGRLLSWLESHDYKAYDPFDGLNARFLRPFTFENASLRTVLQQGVRRFPVNLRPFLGIRPSRSTKAMGYFARAYVRLHQATGESRWKASAARALRWLTRKQSPGYSGACWGNHFDYQSRVFYLPAGVPTIVWTSLIGHAFLDAYDHLHDDEYLATAESACEHIMKDLETTAEEDSVCLSYIPGSSRLVHNANALGASLLARTSALTGNESYRERAYRAMLYTARHQRCDGSWFYGASPNLHWIDNFHTAYVLDSFKHYAIATGDRSFVDTLSAGYRYWKTTFFLADGTPCYYAHKTLPIDIQCSSQAIDTLVFFAGEDPDALALAADIARWTIANMQHASGYFIYRWYGRYLANRTPTLHWGQATMLCALAGLWQLVKSGIREYEKQSFDHR